MIVWLASYPRSGSNFVAAVLRQMSGNGVHCVYQQSAALATSTQSQKFNAWLWELESSPQLHFVRTHNLPGSDAYPAIYLVRDGRDSLVSYAWFELEVVDEIEKKSITSQRLQAKMKSLLKSPMKRFGSWSENVDAWTSRANTATVRFERLIQAPAECLIAAADQLKLKAFLKVEGDLPSFERLQQKRPQIFRNGKVASWESEIPADLLKRFWKKHGPTMRRWNYGEQTIRAA